MRYVYSPLVQIFFQAHDNKTLGIDQLYHKWHLRQVAQTSAKLTPGHSYPVETKTMEATTPELGSVVQNPVPSAVATPL